MTTHYALVTGGGTGLGRAMAQKLADKHILVFIIGRHIQSLIKTYRLNSNNIIPISADISTPAGRHIIFNTVKKIIHIKKINLRYIIHNAGIVKPIKPLEKINLTAFRKIIATNLEAPIFLTQKLLPLLNKHSRILHISSDCAKFPLAHWIPYCVSKAGLLMAYECLKKELLLKKIFMGSFDPGMMITPMQDYICQKKIKFPEKYSAHYLKKNNLLLSPEFSADVALKLLLDFSSADFSLKEYRAYDFRM